MKKSSLLSRTLWLFGLTLTALAGCGGGTGNRTGTAYPSTDWLVYPLDGTTAVDCSAIGADLVATRLTNLSTGEVFDDSFNCSSYQGTMLPVPSGNYTVAYELHAATPVQGGITLLDESGPSQSFYLGAGTTPLEGFDFLVNQFDAAWRINFAGFESRCSDVKASWVELNIYYPQQTNPTQYMLPCLDAAGYMSGRTSGIPIGPYSVQVQAFLLNSSKQDIAQTGLLTFNVSQTAIAELPVFNFTVQ